MTKLQKLFLFLPRVSLGWLMFYAGITKVLNPQWSAAGYLGSAKSFAGFYGWLAAPANIGWVNFVNEWGLTLLGVSLILGIFVRWSSIGGAILMFLYYLAALKFPYPNANSFLVDEHIIYITLLLLFFFMDAGRIWGLDEKLPSLFSKKSGMSPTSSSAINK